MKKTTKKLSKKDQENIKRLNGKKALMAEWLEDFGNFLILAIDEGISEDFDNPDDFIVATLDLWIEIKNEDEDGTEDGTEEYRNNPDGGECPGCEHCEGLDEDDDRGFTEIKPIH